MTPSCKIAHFVRSGRGFNHILLRFHGNLCHFRVNVMHMVFIASSV